MRILPSLIAAVALLAIGCVSSALASQPAFDRGMATPAIQHCASATDLSVPILLTQAPAGQCDVALAAATGLCLTRVASGVPVSGATYLDVFDAPLACGPDPDTGPPG